MPKAVMVLVLGFGFAGLAAFIVFAAINAVDPTRPIPATIQQLTMLVSGALFGALALWLRDHGKGGGDADGAA